MRNTKKLVSLLLAVIMLLTVIPFASFAVSAEGAVCTVDGVEYDDFATALTKTVNGSEVKLLQNCSMKNCASGFSSSEQNPKTITVTAASKDIVLDLASSEVDRYATCTTLYFKDLTIKSIINSWYKGWKHSAGEHYDNCRIIGTITTYGTKATFTNCQFEQDPDSKIEYQLYIYNNDCTLTDCTFSSQGKAVKFYSEGASSKRKLVAKGNTFTSTVDNKAAINVDSTYGDYVVAMVGDTNKTTAGFEKNGIVKVDGGNNGYIINNAKVDENGKIISGTCDKEIPAALVSAFVSEESEMKLNEETGKYEIEGEEPAVLTEGWNEIDGKTYYVKDGEFLTGRQNIKGKLYLFDEEGVQLTGLQKVGPYLAFFLKNKYYNGNAYYGKVTTGGKTYDFTNGPIFLATGWWEFKGNKYYYIDGNLQTGIVEIGGKLYFFDEEGKQAAGLQCVDGKYYYFQALKYGGAAYSGLVSTKDKKVYNTRTDFYAEGPEGWTGKDFYVTGGRKTRGLKTIGKCTYYFDENGDLQTGFYEIDGEPFYFVAKNYGGYAYNGTVYHNGKLYEVNDGIQKGEEIATGFFKVDAHTYEIASADGFVSFNQKIADGTIGRGDTIVLKKNIDLAGKPAWQTVNLHMDFNTKAFKEFDGKGHTIKNFNCLGSGMIGMLVSYDTMTFKNVTFDNATVDGNGGINVAILVGHPYTPVNFEKVTIKNSTATAPYKVALFAGVMDAERPATAHCSFTDCKIENCDVIGTKYGAYCEAGFVANTQYNSVEIEFHGKNVIDGLTIHGEKIYAEYYQLAGYLYVDNDGIGVDAAKNVTVKNSTVVYDQDWK